MERAKRILGKAKKNLVYHLVDTTALLTSSMPAFTAIEVGISGMPKQVSIDSKFTVVALSYGGISWAFSRGRDFTEMGREIYKINQWVTKKAKKQIKRYRRRRAYFASLEETDTTKENLVPNK